MSQYETYGFDPDDDSGNRQDWVRTGQYLSQAMVEVASDLGGEDFATRVSFLSVPDDVLPHMDAIKLLESEYPGSGRTVLDRMRAIGVDTRAQEKREMRSKHSIGNVLLSGFGLNGLKNIMHPDRKSTDNS